MQVVQHASRLPVDNLDYFEETRVKKQKHGDLFPNSCRFLIAGPSGCGKSNALLTLLFNSNGLRFENLYIFSKSLYQPKYKLLEDVVRNISGMGYFPYKDNDEIIDPVDAKENSVFVFDDIACDKQDKIRAFYSMGRHKSIDVAYLSQSYMKIPKHLVRDNGNIIVLFKQDDVNLKHVFGEHVCPDMSYEKFKELCSLCWNEHKHGFLVIIKDFDLKDGRYRKGFDKYIKLEVS